MAQQNRTQQSPKSMRSYFPGPKVFFITIVDVPLIGLHVTLTFGNHTFLFIKNEHNVHVY